MWTCHLLEGMCPNGSMQCCVGNETRKNLIKVAIGNFPFFVCLLKKQVLAKLGAHPCWWRWAWRLVWHVSHEVLAPWKLSRKWPACFLGCNHETTDKGKKHLFCEHYLICRIFTRGERKLHVKLLKMTWLSFAERSNRIASLSAFKPPKHVLFMKHDEYPTA